MQGPAASDAQTAAHIAAHTAQEIRAHDGQAGARAERRSPERMRSRGRSPISMAIVTGILQSIDGLQFLLAGGIAAAALPLAQGTRDQGSILLACLLASLVSTIYLTRGRAYTIDALQSPARQMRIAAKAALLGAGVSILCLFLLQNDHPGIRRWPFLWLIVAGSFFFLSRLVAAYVVRRWMKAGQLARRVAVVGTGEYSRKFIERLRAEPAAYTFVGLYDDRRSRRTNTGDVVEYGAATRGTVAALLERSRQERIDMIAIALPLEAMPRIQKILAALESAVADVCLTTGLVGVHYTSSNVSAVGANPVILISERPFKGWSAVSKMLFDLTLAVALLLVCSPLLAVIALCIRLDSPGPVLFRQPRRGFNHQIFACFKFRTMHVERTDLLADRQTTRDDPRVTRVGRWLRRSSLDELPQLLNVLRGEMSLVGPRPHAPNTRAADQLFEDVVSQYATRHRVKPGITGWAQVNGWRGETRTVEQIEQRVACDLSYIERWSLLFDLKILTMTLTRGMFSANAF